MIPIWNSKTGTVWIRNFDQGVFDTMGAIANPVTQKATGIPCYSLNIPGIHNGAIPVFFAQPEQAFRAAIYPCATVNRDEFTPAMHRWMGVGQIEYKAGVSGTQAVINGREGFLVKESKVQAIPFDFTYTISAFDRYETGAQLILQKLLRIFQPVGTLAVLDSLGLQRTYASYLEGAVASLKEIIDPVNKVNGYAITIRVEGELDLADPIVTQAVSGFDLFMHRMK